jgi:hypothetical protein
VLHLALILLQSLLRNEGVQSNTFTKSADELVPDVTRAYAYEHRGTNAAAEVATLLSSRGPTFIIAKAEMFRNNQGEVSARTSAGNDTEIVDTPVRLPGLIVSSLTFQSHLYIL